MQKNLLFSVFLAASAPLCFAPEPASAQVEVGCTCYCGIQLNPPCSENACKSACGYSGGASTGYNYGQPVNIAWGGTTKRILQRAAQCTNPICTGGMLFAGLPVGLLWDLPVWTVQGVGYLGKGVVYVGKNAGKGLVYAGKGVGKGVGAVGRGIGKGFKATGSAIASPFKRDMGKISVVANNPAGGCSAAWGHDKIHAEGNWAACKKNILKRQRALTKQDGRNKMTERWCKRNIPMSSGPHRLNWETTCNPGVKAVMVDPPFSDPLNSPSPTTAAQLTKPGVAPADAVPAAEARAERSPEEIIAEVEAVEKKMELLRASGLAPAASTPAAPPVAASALPPELSLAHTQAAQAAPMPGALRSLSTVAQDSPEDLRAAAQSGFDGKGAMLGETAAGAPAIGPGAGAAPGMPTKAAAAGKPAAALQETLAQSGSPASGAWTSPTAPPAFRGMHLGGGKDDLPLTETVAQHPEVVQGKSKLIGDPNRYKDFFKRQTGNTCALVSMQQILGAMGIPAAEHDLFWDAFRRGYFGDSMLCHSPALGDVCALNYTAAANTCSVVDSNGAVLISGDFVCDSVRRDGGTTLGGIGRMLKLTSGRAVVNASIPSIENAIRTMGAANAVHFMDLVKKTILPDARKEVVESLKRGNGVMITVEAGTLWNKPGPRAMHTVLVTAAVMGEDGEPVGFYINDSATGEHGKFLPLREFDRAWLNDDLQRVYIQ